MHQSSGHVQSPRTLERNDTGQSYFSFRIMTSVIRTGNIKGLEFVFD